MSSPNVLEEIRTMLDGKPANTEQLQAVAAIRDCTYAARIAARAGTGKTYTCALLGNVLPRNLRVLYVVFSRDAKEDAEKRMPGNFEVRTAHSLAYREMIRIYNHRMKGRQRLRPMQVEDALNLPLGSLNLSPSNQANLILGFIRNFCYSAESELSLRHAPPQMLLRAVPTQDGRGSGARKYSVQERQNMARELAKALLPSARKLWEKIADPQDRHELPVEPDHYLKIWAMSNPQLRKDLIILDEAQDANPVMLQIIESQERARKAFIGDDYQQIFGWRGASNALGQISFDQEATLVQSFRFGEGVAAVANRVLEVARQAPGDLRGTEGKDGHIVVSEGEVASYDFDAILCRNNATVMGELFAADAAGKKKPFILGGVKSMLMLVKDAERLQNHQNPVTQDLTGFSSWQEVVDYSESDFGGDLKAFVELVNEYGTSYLIQRLEPLEDIEYEEADIVIGTAHRSKGMDWPRVRLAGDFPELDDEFDAEGGNLLYVACTRAKELLDISACKPALQSIGINHEEQDPAKRRAQVHASVKPYLLDASEFSAQQSVSADKPQPEEQQSAPSPLPVTIPAEIRTAMESLRSQTNQEPGEFVGTLLRMGLQSYAESISPECAERVARTLGDDQAGPAPQKPRYRGNAGPVLS